VRRRKVIAVVAGSLTLLLDQLSKILIASKLSPGDSVPILGDLLWFGYTRNPRGVFGLSFGPVPLVPVSLIAIAVLFLLLFRMTGRGSAPLAISLILGGAVGNLIDRVRLGEVIDFLDFGLGRYRWPTFNLADAGVTVGALLLLLTGWRRQA